VMTLTVLVAVLWLEPVWNIGQAIIVQIRRENENGYDVPQLQQRDYVRR
jgi:hypothetical protein